MNKLVKGFALGLMLTILVAGTAISVAAQSGDEKADLYQKYTDNYAGTIDQRKIAISAAKEYVQKYGSSEDDAAIVDYMKEAIPSLEQSIKEEEKAAAEAKALAEKNARYNAFDSAVTAAKTTNNYDAVYSTGQNILASEPDMLDVILVLGSLGLDETFKNPPVNKYNDATLKYAQMAIDKINNGAKSNKYGAYSWEYKNKENALGWMNYTIGMINYFKNSNGDSAKQQQALRSLYDSTKFNWEKKNEPRIYGTIGDWYFSKARDLSVESEALLKTNRELVKARNATEDEAEEASLDKKIDANEAQITRTLNLGRAYADRSIDAYARALQLAKNNPKEKAAYRTSLQETLKELFNFRYEKPQDKTDTKINTYVATVLSKPMPDPMSTVKPIAAPIIPVTKIVPSTRKK